MKTMHKILVVFAIIAVSGVSAYAGPRAGEGGKRNMAEGGQRQRQGGAADKSAREGVGRRGGRGCGAMNLMSKLDLTPEQMTAIREIRKANAEQMKQARQEARAQGDLRPHFQTKGADAMGRRAQIMEQVKEVLTADQLAKLEALREKKCEQAGERMQNKRMQGNRGQGGQRSK